MKTPKKLFICLNLYSPLLQKFHTYFSTRLKNQIAELMDSEALVQDHTKMVEKIDALQTMLILMSNSIGILKTLNSKKNPDPVITYLESNNVLASEYVTSSTNEKSLLN
eukprot:snap_masked-scaffold_8-processed-gene-4.39-mRNA-1 protein AED:1.00 eAED:1.00 QI:0/-1/0/0/-1/1/1/0/108